MEPVPEELKQAADALRNGQATTTTIRSFLRWFGHEKRGWRVVGKIRRALNEVELATVPDFEFAWIDGQISFARESKEEPKPEVPAMEYSSNSVEVPKPVTLVGGAIEDPTYRVGKLEAANTPPISIKPDATLQEAVTIMLKEDFSQLPVMTSERDVKGVISWRTIAIRQALGKQCQVVRDCMEADIEIVDVDVSLFRVIGLIANKDFVLVRDKERKISGILTAADLGESFYQLGRPFLLLSEIENHIRGIIDGKFTMSELSEVRNPTDSEREISDVSDMTFGEYVRLLQNPDRWGKIGLNIDRTTFIKNLERVNAIRNDVMHFDPDGIGKDDLEELRKTAKFVQELREVVGAGK